MSSPQSSLDAASGSEQDRQAAQKQPWLELVAAKVAKIRYGSVHISVHNGEVTAVECVEKTRFNQPSGQAPHTSR